ncbi:BAR adaptor protein Hob3 [Coemansia spiralis]|uniref:BAR adaptor protein Hob3 n=2 Tax=Coemansia TaxID=4863 RepID=A0A9W8GAL9_9FUNG|nr:BAR adaptor protein Hob3 [Coemansia spiralis]
MSFWDNTKKSVSRAGAGLRMGGGTQQADPEFNEQEQRFRNLERRAMKLLQETKDYRVSVTGMVTSQNALAENLTAFLLDVQRPQDYQGAYRQAAMAIMQNSHPQFDEAYAQTVMEPMAQYCGYMPEFTKALKKHKHLIDDLDKAKRALAKEQGKAADDVMCVERAEQDVQYAEDAYKAMDKALVTEIPKLINARVYVTDPSFEAFVKTQLQFFSDSLEQMDKVARYLPPQGGSDDEKVLDRRVEDVMEQVRSLTICTLNV